MTFTSVKEIFSGMQARFKPDAAKGMNAVFQFEITGEGGGSWNATIKDGNCQMVEGKNPSPTVTLTMASDTWLGIVNKQVPNLLIKLLENPEMLLETAKTALLELDLPIDVLLDKAHLRIVELPRLYKSREMRSDHIDKLIAIEGLVRTATEVRPKIVSAAFQCQRCGYTFFREQKGTRFDDANMKCQNDACDRSGPFKIDLSNSKFVDAQKKGFKNHLKSCEGENNRKPWT